MAINISTANDKPSVKVKLVSKNTTKVQKVVIGRPVRRVTQSSGSLGSLDDVDLTGKVDGSVLVYNDVSSKFEATLTLEKQLINGGQY